MAVTELPAQTTILQVDFDFQNPLFTMSGIPSHSSQAGSEALWTGRIYPRSTISISLCGSKNRDCTVSKNNLYQHDLARLNQSGMLVTPAGIFCSAGCRLQVAG